MRKYWTLFIVSWQKQLEVRSEFLFERTRSVSILFSLYFLWTALLQNRESVMGYNRDQLLTYVFMMTLLRAWVLACVTDRIPMEISRGRMSDLLLRPISPIGYWAAQDAASKLLNLSSAILEVGVFCLIVSAPFSFPDHLFQWFGFGAATLGGMILYFQMSYMLGVMGFWTSQSWGPRFCFEIILEFCAGAYFPIDILPATAQKLLSLLPFPYLIFYPLQVFLGRIPANEYTSVFLHQVIWIVILGIGLRTFWRWGLRHYAAEGG